MKGKTLLKGNGTKSHALEFLRGGTAKCTKYQILLRIQLIGQTYNRIWLNCENNNHEHTIQYKGDSRQP